jgi:hypothetical protein
MSTTGQSTADVLVIGGGLIGSVLLARLRAESPDARVLLVDAGPPIGPVRGGHLHDVEDPDLHRQYNGRVALGNQALYVGAATNPPLTGPVSGATPGIYGLGAFGEDADPFPGAAIAWNAGGMGVHWTAATPSPTGSEVPACIAPDEWDHDLRQASRALLVHDDPYGPDRLQRAVLAAIDDVVPVDARSRSARPMPMAVSPQPDGRLLRTGPSRVFPPSALGSDRGFDVLGSTLCRRLLHRDGVVTGAVVADASTGEEREIIAARVVVACDVVRTPQLLWASGIRPAALGRGLNEHAFLTGRVAIDLERIGVALADLPARRPGEWCIGSYWLPRSGDHQPFQGQLMAAPTFDVATGVVSGCSISVSVYVPLRGDPSNRIEFVDGESDAAGLPRARVHFVRTDEDERMIDQGRLVQAALGRALGPFDPGEHAALLAPGASLHATGTTRIGPVDDGTSVADSNGRVWGFRNLWVAGNGTIPTQMTANTTLTAAAIAVRTARDVVAADR